MLPYDNKCNARTSDTVPPRSKLRCDDNSLVPDHFLMEPTIEVSTIRSAWGLDERIGVQVLFDLFDLVGSCLGSRGGGSGNDPEAHGFVLSLHEPTTKHISENSLMFIH